MRIFGFDSAANLNAENGVRRRVFIYSLSDPRDGKVRYVGKSINYESRFAGHLADKGTTRKANWIKSLAKQGLKPVVEAVEETSDALWWEAEQFWIEQFRQWGFPLTNGNGGGIGGHNPTEETKKKLRFKHSEEWNRKVALAKTGTTLSDETKAKLRQFALNRPESVRRKISIANRGKKRSLESRIKQSQTSRANGVPEKLSALLKGKKQNISKESILQRQAKMIVARKLSGKPWHSEETKQRMREAAIKRFSSPEARAKVGLITSRRMANPEARIKISESLKRYNSMRKEPVLI